MSLYNTLFGMNNEAPILLGMLKVNMEYFDRFRDIELINSGSIIRVFTRLGGGNREYYQETWNKIREHELYKTDYDDDFDCTYAYIEFNIPEKFKDTAKKMYKGEPVSFEDKFKKELDDMNLEGTDANKRAKEIANKFNEVLKNDKNNGIKIIEI